MRISSLRLAAATLAIVCSNFACSDTSAPAADSGLTPADGDTNSVDGSTSADRGIHTAPDLLVPEPLPEILMPAERCAEAPTIALTGGKAVIDGSTAGLGDSLPALKCGGREFIGPKGFYRLPVSPDKVYKVTLRAAFPAMMAFFKSTGECQQEDIESACSVGWGVRATRAYLASDVEDAFTIFVGSTYTTPQAGLFTLLVETFERPSNATCATAQTLSFVEGVAEVSGLAAGAVDEFPALTCAGQQPIDGDQVYYSLTLSAEKRYDFSLTPNYAAARLVLFREAAECQLAAIESDCSSGGASGAVAAAPRGGHQSLLTFAPRSDGAYTIAIDGVQRSRGEFKLRIDEAAPAVHGDCSGALPVTLQDGRATIRGTTAGASNEFQELKCGGLWRPTMWPSSGPSPIAASGPQVYYRVGLTAGETYRFTLTPSFNAALYVFSDAANCVEAAIEADCLSEGASGARPSYGPQQSREVHFAPSASGQYIVAVDTAFPVGGSFTLDIEQLVPPASSGCRAAAPLQLTNGQAIVKGNTTLHPNDLEGLQCAPRLPLAGPQAYYQLPVVEGRPYLLRLTPTFDGALALFSGAANCEVAKVATDCTSAGATGGILVASAGETSALVHFPRQSGTVYLSVDSVDESGRGSFTLQVDEGVEPSHSRCDQAKALPLSANPTIVRENTRFARNEFEGIDCGMDKTGWRGPQLYYRVQLAAGRQHTIRLTPDYDAALYAVAASTACEATAIDLACESPAPVRPGNVYVSDAKAQEDFTSSIGCGCGTSTIYGFGGEVAPLQPAGEVLRITPQTTGDWIIVVDSSAEHERGSFTLEVGWE